MLFGYGLAYSVNLFLKWEVPGWVLLLLAVLLEGFFGGRVFLKKRGIRIDRYLLCVLAAFLFFLVLRWNKIPYLEELTEYYQSFIFYGKIDIRYGFLLLVALMMAGSLFYKVVSKNTWVNLVFSAAVLTFLIIQTVFKIQWDLLPTAAFICVAVNGLLGEYLKFSDWDKGKVKKAYYPLLILVALLIILRPNPITPISWKPVVTAWENVKTTTNELLCKIAYGDRESVFSTAKGGFDRTDVGFWGTLTDTSMQKLMKIKISSGKENGDAYFVGTIYDDYEQNHWSEHDKNTKTKELECYWNFKERLYHIYQSNASSEEESHFCKQSVYNLKYLSLRTRLLFYPRNCIEITPIDINGDIVNQNGNTLFQKKQNKGNQYEVRGIQFNLENEEFQNYIRYGQKGSAERIADSIYDETQTKLGLTVDEKEKIISSDTKKEIAKRKESMEEYDLQIPNSVPERVYKLAEEITKDQDNDYDKAQAIITYLKQSGEFKYTKKTSGMPQESEAVDHFLFETRQGYCKHFATSAVILCRCAGIPSRYVEGAYVTYGISGREDTYILGKDAHAWAQVYLENYGWLDMDPTPGYGPKSSFKVAVRSKITPAVEEKKDIKTEEEDKNHGRKEKDWAQTVAALTMILLLSALLIAAISFLLIWLNRYRYRHSSDREKMEICMRKIFSIRKKRKMPLGQNETLREYMNRLKCKEQLNDCIEIYERVRYGNKQVSDEEICILEQQCRTEKIELQDWRKGHRRNWYVLLKKRINDRIRKRKNRDGVS